MKFRKKPVIVEAEQFQPWLPKLPLGVHRETEGPEPTKMCAQTVNFYVVTIHGQRVYLERGDWILPEPDGIHFYPVKPDIFAATYEPVE